MIEEFFKARRIAVIGASEGSYFSDRLVENLARTSKAVEIVFVSKTRNRLYKKKTVASLLEVKESCQLAFILAGASCLPEILPQCAEIGIKNVVTVASTEDDRKLALEVRKIVEKCRINLLGPSSQGFVDVYEGLYCFAGRVPGSPLPAGRVSVISESGGLLNEFYRTTVGEKRWGIRRAIACGEGLTSSAADLMLELLQDSLTGCVVLLLRGLNNRRVLSSALAQALLKQKPVVVFSSFGYGGGVSLKGLSVAQLFATEPDRGQCLYFNGICSGYGVFAAGSIDEAAEVAGALAPEGLRRAGEGMFPRWTAIRGKKTAIVSVSGGIGQWIKFVAQNSGFEVPPPGSKCKKQLKDTAGLVTGTNPVDLSGRILSDEGKFVKVVEAVATSGSYDIVVIPINPPDAKTSSDERNMRWLSQIAEVMSDKEVKSKGVAVVPVKPSSCRGRFEDGGWVEAKPVFGVETLFKIVEYAISLRNKEGTDERSRRVEMLDYESARLVLRGYPRYLSEASSRKVFSHYGIEFDKWINAKSRSSAVDFWRRMKVPLMMRLAVGFNVDDSAFSQRFLRNNLQKESEIRRAFIDIMAEAKKEFNESDIVGVIVQPQVKAHVCRVETYSYCDGSPPVIVVGSGNGRDAVDMAPVGRRGAVLAAGRIGSVSGMGFDSVKLGEMLRRVSFLASDFMEEISSIRADFSISAGGGIVCSRAWIRIITHIE